MCTNGRAGSLTIFGVLMVAITCVASAATPEGVSPGAVDRFAAIRGECPTFSWGEIEGAAFYEVVVYEVPLNVDLSAKLELTADNEVLYTKIIGSALSWTPEANRCFVAGGGYTWFVRAVLDADTGEATEWSEGRFFSVAAAPSAEEVRRALGVLSRYVEHGGAEVEELGSLLSDVGASVPAGREDRSRTSSTPKAALAGSAAIRGEMPDLTGEIYGVYGITNSSTGGSFGVVGEATAPTGEVYGLAGLTASVEGAGVIAFNAAGGTDLILGADEYSAHLTELGLDRAVPGVAVFDFTNSDGAGSMTLRVDGVDVVTAATDEDSLGELSCASGELAKWDGSQWACAPDDGTAYTAGNQLDLVGTTFNVLEGSGSGLDADTLDSHNTDYFATAVHNHFGQFWSGASSYGLQAENIASGGVGLIGKAIGSSGQGVRGTASASTGFTKGVEGLSNSSDGQGVYGRASSPTGNAYGVFGVSYSNSGRGVYGYTTSATGPTRGVLGESQSINGIGVFGDATASSGSTRGVYGRSVSAVGSGVYGYANETTDVNYGVQGRTESAAGYGGFFNNAAGGVDIMAGGSGDVAQTLEGNGLVKAGVFVRCEVAPYFLRSFSNVPGAGPMTVTEKGLGWCDIDFGFSLEERYWSTTVTIGGMSVGCFRLGDSDSKLSCTGIDYNGSYSTFVAHVLIY